MRRSALILLTVLLVAGCQSNVQRLNTPPQGYSAPQHPMAESFQNMSDNAALADMSVADIHFIGNTDRLSGTGVYRLNQLGEAIKRYGVGEVRYTTDLTDDTLLNARLQRIEKYLAEADCDMQAVSVRLGAPMGPGMQAERAMQAQAAPDAAGSKGRSSEVLPKIPGFGEGRK